MEAEKISYLYKQYRSGKLSASELEELKALAPTAEFESQYHAIFDQNWENLARGDVRAMPDHIRQEQLSYITSQPRQASRTLKLWSRVGIAAAVATMIVSAGIWFYKFNNKSIDSNQDVYTHDIAPGRQGATLTLANGQRISVKEALAGNIANQSGVRISKDKHGQIIYEVSGTGSGKLEYNTLSTTRGEHTQIRLPDGSVVFLNAASSLKYPTSFAKAATRRVSLTGEGYFEISKDKAHPFIVTTVKQEVQVLGTHFNINAYPDEPAVATTLLEGSVKVTSGENQQILKPGFQAINNGSAVTVTQANNLESITDWKDGDFNLDGLDFRLAMRKIGRWYDVEVIYDPGVPQGIKTGGWISRDNKLSDILKLIEKSGFVHFKVEGKKVYVSK